MVVMIVGRFCTSATSSFIPASMISGIAEITALIMPSIICGITSTIAAMMSGRAVTSEVRSCIPASIICGIALMRKSTIPVIICGRASMRIGSESKIPCASSVISCKAASKMSGRLSTSVFTISTTTATICGTSCGIVSAMPLMSDSRISAPADTICGSSPTRAEIISVTILAMVGVSSEIADRSPSASALMIPGALSRTAPAIEVMSSANCGISVRIVSITDVTPLFSSSAACSLPARRSARPSVICVIPGRSSPTMRFFRPPAVCDSLVRLSSKAAEAATASLLITMP